LERTTAMEHTRVPFAIRGTGTSQVTGRYLDRIGADQRRLPLAQRTEQLPVTAQ